MESYLKKESIKTIESLIDAMLNSEEFNGDEHVIQKARKLTYKLKDNE